jgi:hypothetical protein
MPLSAVAERATCDVLIVQTTPAISDKPPPA